MGVGLSWWLIFTHANDVPSLQSFIKTSYNFTSDKQLSLFQIGVAGAASAIPTTAIMAPGERIKCILQVQDSQVRGQTRNGGVA
jgi:solute carrier family 25 carnitine/acylcarnitine transporter 20/29